MTNLLCVRLQKTLDVYLFPDVILKIKLNCYNLKLNVICFVLLEKIFKQSLQSSVN